MRAKRLNPTLRSLLAVLNDCQWHDGNALGKHLNVSRTAIWKFIHFLQAYGVDALGRGGAQAKDGEQMWRSRKNS